MIQTPWGYDLDEVNLPPLLTEAEFNTLSGGRWSGNPQVAPMLAAVSQAVRNYCNWHVSPSLKCVAKVSAERGYLQLPGMNVTQVSSVTEGDETLADYEWKRNGSVRGCFDTRWQGVEVAYTCGLDDVLVKTIVTQIACNCLAAPGGVREEHAGQVGITYNQTASGVSGGVSLLERDKDMLAPYRISAVM